MKNLLQTSLLSFLFTSSLLQANEFISISTGKLFSENSKILGIQPASEIVGGNSSYYDIKFGYKSKKDHDKVYAFISLAPEKNNEHTVGIGAELTHALESVNHLYIKLGAQAGLGKQSVAGKTANTSTSANKVSYIVDQQNTLPTTIKYEDDTYLLSIGLLLGLEYEVVDNFTLSTNYMYRQDNYQVAYRNVNNSTVLNALTMQQDNHLFSISLNYNF